MSSAHSALPSIKDKIIARSPFYNCDPIQFRDPLAHWGQQKRKRENLYSDQNLSSEFNWQRYSIQLITSHAFVIWLYSMEIELDFSGWLHRRWFNCGNCSTRHRKMRFDLEYTRGFILFLSSTLQGIPFLNWSIMQIGYSPRLFI